MSYLINNPVTTSYIIRHSGQLVANQILTLPIENVSQFASGTLSIDSSAQVSVQLYSSNSGLPGDTWSLIGDYASNNSLEKYQVPLGFVQLKAIITAGPVNCQCQLRMFYTTQQLSASQNAIITKSLDQELMPNDQFSISRSVLAGRVNGLNAPINVSVSAAGELHVAHKTNRFHLMDQDKLCPEVKIDMLGLTNNMGETASPPKPPSSNKTKITGSVNYTNNTITMTDATLSTTGATSCPDDSVLIFRAAAKFSGTDSYLGFGKRCLALGTDSTGGLGLYIHTSGARPRFRVSITDKNVSTTTINITLGTDILPVTILYSTTKAECASNIANAVNANNKWTAVSIGNDIIFSTLLPVDAPNMSIDPGTSGITSVINVLEPGIAPAVNFVPASSFVLDKLDGTGTLPAWSSNNYMEFELASYNGGLTAKLSVVDNRTHVLVDVHIMTLAEKHVSSAEVPIISHCSPTGTIVIYSGVLSSLRNPSDIIGKSYYSKTWDNLNVSIGGSTLCALMKSDDIKLCKLKSVCVVNMSPNKLFIVISRGGSLSGDINLAAEGQLLVWHNDTDVVMPLGNKIIERRLVAESKTIQIGHLMQLDEPIFISAVPAADYYGGHVTLDLVFEG